MQIEMNGDTPARSVEHALYVMVECAAHGAARREAAWRLRNLGHIRLEQRLIARALHHQRDLGLLVGALGPRLIQQRLSNQLAAHQSIEIAHRACDLFLDLRRLGLQDAAQLGRLQLYCTHLADHTVGRALRKRDCGGQPEQCKDDFDLMISHASYLLCFLIYAPRRILPAGAIGCCLKTRPPRTWTPSATRAER